MRPEKLFIGNGSQFTDHFTGQEQAANWEACLRPRVRLLLGIEYGLIKPRHPRADGMI